MQCVANTGVCPCTGTAVASGLWTPCRIENEFGICLGKRVCTADGLSDCDASQPSEEICNGTDDDCDKDVDEPALLDDSYVGLCDDGNPCTKDQCNGSSGCAQTALAEGQCLDGNPCTVADHCESGVCVGDAVDCDDKNPCTQDICTATGGCEHPAAPGECDDADPCTLGDHCIAGICQGAQVACDCQSDADCKALEDGNICNGTLVCDVTSVPYVCVVDHATEVT